MQWNRHRLTDVERATKKEGAVAADERTSNVGPGRAVDDQRAGTGHERGKEGGRAPLAGRYPHLIGQQQHDDDAAVGRVVDVLAVHAQQELAADRHNRREHGKVGAVRAQQQTQGEPGDQGAACARSEWCRSAGQPVADPLGCEHRGQHEDDSIERDIELQPPHAIDEQGRERSNLIQPRVRHAGSTSGLRTIPPRFLARVPNCVSRG